MHIDKAVAAWLSGVVRATTTAPRRTVTLGTVKCDTCTFSVQTKSSNPAKDYNVTLKIKRAEDHDPECAWRKKCEATERLADMLLGGQEEITIDDLVGILPDKLVNDARAVMRKDGVR